jgi:hypothetical protein
MKWITTVIKNQKIRRLVASAIDLYHEAQRHRVRADVFAKDPDAAFEALIRTAAQIAGWKVSEAEIDIIRMEVARVVMGRNTDELTRNLKALDAMFERTKGKI